MKRLLLALAAVLALAAPAQAQFFNDSFSCTPGVSLQDTTSTSGHDWDLHPGGIHGLVCDGSGVHYGAPDAFSYAVLHPVVTPPSADYYTECVLYVHTHNLEQYAGCSVRLQAANVTAYDVVYDTLSSAFIVEEVTAGSAATLASYPYVVSNATSYAVRLQIVGSTVSLYVNAVLQGTASDATITGAGRPGIQNYNPSATTDTTHIHFQSISAAEVTTSSSGVTRALLGVW